MLIVGLLTLLTPLLYMQTVANCMEVFLYIPAVFSIVSLLAYCDPRDRQGFRQAKSESSAMEDPSQSRDAREELLI